MHLKEETENKAEFPRVEFEQSTLPLKGAAPVFFLIFMFPQAIKRPFPGFSVGPGGLIDAWPFMVLPGAEKHTWGLYGPGRSML